MKTLLVIDMQNDFINGALGSPEAKAILPNVAKKIREYQDIGHEIIFTQDTHFENYLQTQEGQKLPVEHCIINTPGWEIPQCLNNKEYITVLKNTFGSFDLESYINENTDLEIIGLCTDICVVSNALILKATFPEMKIKVDSNCCAGTTPEAHEAALTVMRSCQIEVI